ncbi:hypothetical protein RSAG8_07353, partial [Rhizoctonia solani AG-8 WAC10335]
MDQTVRFKRSRGLSPYQQVGISKKATVYGRQPAPSSVEEATRPPSFLKSKPKRLSRTQLMALAEKDRARDELLMKDKLTREQQKELEVLQERVNANEPGIGDGGDMYDTMDDNWVDIEDDETESNKIDMQEIEVIEQLGVTGGTSEWAKRLSAEHGAWKEQIAGLCDAYLTYRATGGSMGAEGGVAAGSISLPCILLKEKRVLTFPLDPNSCARSLLLHGYIVPTPARPKIAFNLDVLELTDAIQRRSPSTSVQAMAKALCDLRNVPYKRYHRVQLSAALDVYHMVCREAEHRLGKMLGLDSPDSKLKSSCAPCMYELEDEPEQKYKIMVTCDGNESLKRCSHAGTADKRMSQKAAGKSSSTEKTECERRWKNASADKRPEKKAKNYFHETGVVTSTCRHSFLLTICDMVRSGEQAKYCLATVNRLISVFGRGVLMGYDIGCTMKKTVKRSTMLGSKATTLGFDMCVGSFHGHAHNRSCQVENHPLHRTGNGLTDFENNEHLYSCSNLLASATRLASPYHRHQKIHLFIVTWNNDMYEALGHLLRTKYINALNVIDSATEFLSHTTHTAKDYEAFFSDEKKYLVSFKAELPEDLFAIMYVELLELLELKQEEFDSLHKSPINCEPEMDLRRAAILTSHAESQRRTVLEQLMNTQNMVQKMEMERQITRWTRDSPQWIEAQRLKQLRHFNKCLATLEHLVVQRVIEMGRVGLARTGYKLRQHILRSLVAGCSAIKTALAKYNQVAAEISPPAPMLTWEKIADASVLADVHILEGSRRGVLKKPWAQSQNRRCVEEYHRLLRAHEEIERLNIEIKRLATAIADEKTTLTNLIKNCEPEDTGNNWLLQHYAERRLAVNTLIGHQLELIRKLPGYTGSHTTGIRFGGEKDTGHSNTGDPDIEMEPAAPGAQGIPEAEAQNLHASVEEETEDLHVGDDIIDQFDKWQIALDHFEDLRA